jgi:hypothetical protein
MLQESVAESFGKLPHLICWITTFFFGLTTENCSENIGHVSIGFSHFQRATRGPKLFLLYGPVWQSHQPFYVIRASVSSGWQLNQELSILHCTWYRSIGEMHWLSLSLKTLGIESCESISSGKCFSPTLFVFSFIEYIINSFDVISAVFHLISYTFYV